MAKKKKITPHGHIEERLKTIRKFDGVHAQATRKRKSISPTTFDVAGKPNKTVSHTYIYNK